MRRFDSDPRLQTLLQLLVCLAVRPVLTFRAGWASMGQNGPNFSPGADKDFDPSIWPPSVVTFRFLDGRLMRCYPVSKRVNHVANDDEGCFTGVEPVQSQARLFS